MYNKDLRFDRLLLLIGLIIFVVWGFIYKIIMPEAQDPINLRVIGSLVLATLLVSSFYVSEVKRHFSYYLYGLCYLLTLHQATIVLSNDLSPQFVIIYFSIIIIFNAYFKSITHLIVYAFYNTLVIIVGYFIISKPITDFGFLLSTILSVNILTVLIFRSRIKTEQRLIYSEELMSSIFNGSSDILILTGLENLKILDCNEIFYKFYNLTKTDIEGKDLKDFFNNQLNNEDIDSIKEAIISNKTWKGEKLIRKQNDFYWADIAIRIIHPGKAKLLLVRISDVTERKEAELELNKKTSELQKSNAELEQMAFIASHDLQEPLRTIAGYVQLIQKRYKDKLDETGEEFIQYAVEGAERMKSLITDLLTYSRVGAGNPGNVSVNCSKILDTVLNNLHNSINENEAKIIIPEPLPIIKANEVEISQLFQNLLSNSIKYRTSLPPEIKMEFKQINDPSAKGLKGWHFFFTDNGIGIEPQYKEKIFEVFQRLHPKDKYTGTGIGLAICKKIVERYNGKIWVEQAPEQGSVFNFILWEL